MPPKRKASTQHHEPEPKRPSRAKTKQVATPDLPPPAPEEEMECSICYENCNDDYGTLKCKHSFCFPCIEQWSKQKNACPLCNGVFKEISHYSEKLFGRSKKGLVNFKKIKVKTAHPRTTYHAPPPRPPLVRQNAISPSHFPFRPNGRNAPFFLQQLMGPFNGEIFDDEDEDDEDDDYNDWNQDPGYTGLIFGPPPQRIPPGPRTINLLDEPTPPSRQAPLGPPREPQLVDLTVDLTAHQNPPTTTSNHVSLITPNSGVSSVATLDPLPLNSSSSSLSFPSQSSSLNAGSNSLVDLFLPNQTDSPVIDLRENEVISLE